MKITAFWWFKVICQLVTFAALHCCLTNNWLRNESSQCVFPNNSEWWVSCVTNCTVKPARWNRQYCTSVDVSALSGVIERWELHQAQRRSNQHAGPQEPQKLTSDLDDITSWLENVIPELDRLQQSDPAASIDDMAARARELKVTFKCKYNSPDDKSSVSLYTEYSWVCYWWLSLLQEMHKMFTRYKSVMLSVNLRALEAPEQQERLTGMNRDWSRACTGLQQWDTSLRKTLICCQVRRNTKYLI